MMHARAHEFVFLVLAASCLLSPAAAGAAGASPMVGIADGPTRTVRPEDNDDRSRFVPDEIIIKLKNSAVPVELSGGPTETALRFNAVSAGANRDSGNRFIGILSRYGIAFDRPLIAAMRNPDPSKPRAIDAIRRDWGDIVTRAAKLQAAKGREVKVGTSTIDAFVNVYVVKVDPEQIFAALAELSSDPHVEYAHLNYTGYADAFPLPSVSYIPNDPYVSTDHVNWAQSLGLTFPDLWGIRSTETLQAWSTFANPTLGPGSGVQVAVVDTGVNTTHPDIAQRIWVNPGEDLNHNGIVDASDVNGVDDDGDGYVDDFNGWNFIAGSRNVTDDNGHGTHVAGTIAATANNGQGVVGVAPNVQIIPVKVMNSGGGGTCDSFTNGLVYTSLVGADVSNNSWGFGGLLGYCPGIVAGVQLSSGMGVAVVAAAGNAHRNAASTLPAGLPQTITAAASDSNDAVTSFSSFGSAVDVAAPGQDILSLGLTPLIPGSYGRLNGTSMASPHVAGAAALVLSHTPSLSVEQVRQALQQGADDIATPGWDGSAGAGRLNARRAVQLQPLPVANILNFGHDAPAVCNESVGLSATVSGVGASFSGWSVRTKKETDTSWQVLSQGTGAPPSSVPWSVYRKPFGNYLLEFTAVDSTLRQGIETRRVQRLPFEETLPTQMPNTVQGIYAVGLGDFDDDGDNDVVLCGGTSLIYAGNASQQIWINNGTATFQDATATWLPGPNFDCNDVEVADFTGDGRPDLFFLSGDSAAHRLYRNTGTGFVDESASRLPTLTYGGTPEVGRSAIGDVDGDGDLDIVMSNPGAVLLNSGTGVFTNATATAAPWLTSCSSASRNPCDMALVDVDNDGDLDLVSHLGVGRNNGLGVFTNAGLSGLTTRIGENVVFGDITGDGLPDAVAGGDGLVRVFRNIGGTFTSTDVTGLNDLAPIVSLYDADFDGDLDVVAFTMASPYGQVSLGNQVLLNGGTGTFVPQTDGWGLFEPLATLAAPQFGDLNGDNIPDMVVGGFNELTRIYLGRQSDFRCEVDCNNSGTVDIAELVQGVNIAMGSQPLSGCRAADVNGDGRVTVTEIIRGRRQALQSQCTCQ